MHFSTPLPPILLQTAFLTRVRCLKTEAKQHRLEGNILDFNPHIGYDIHNMNQSRIIQTDTIHPKGTEYEPIQFVTA